MQHYTAQQYQDLADLHNECERADELLDGRFAVVGQICYEIIEYKGCPNGKNYAILWVKSAQHCYGPETLVGNTDVNMRLTDVYVSENLSAIEGVFLQLIVAGLNKY